MGTLKSKGLVDQEKSVDEPTIKIELVYSPLTKHLTINGNINDRLVTYGILEMAKDVLKPFYEQLTREAIDAANDNARANADKNVSNRIAGHDKV